MNINNLDIELNTKAKESLKSVLKKKGVEILFSLPILEENIIEMTTVKESQHYFLLIKKFETTELMNINQKYYNLIRNKLKIKLKNLTMLERIKLIKRKTWYLFFLYPFYGKMFSISTEKLYIYRLNYNSVVMDLSKFEYDRFFYYIQYVYKLQQLYKLNKELNIDQEFSIIFDDDKSALNLYKNMYNNFKGLIEPNRNIDNNDKDDIT